MSKNITSNWFNNNLICISSASKRDGVFTLRKSYFYRNGMTPEAFAELITTKLTDKGINHTIESYGDHFAPFRGGDSVAKGSHFWVKVKINS